MSEKKLFRKQEILDLLGSAVTEVLEEKDIFNFFNMHLKAIVSKASSTFTTLEATQKNHHKAMKTSLQELKKTLHDFSLTVANLEESILYIFHNVKKNQFLYAHYPDDWVTDYLSIKEGVKFENEYMEKKDEGRATQPD